MVIAQAARLLPGSTVFAPSPSGRMTHGCVPAFRRITRPGLAGCASTVATTVS
jgi:hypothetical protein